MHYQNGKQRGTEEADQKKPVTPFEKTTGIPTTSSPT